MAIITNSSPRVALHHDGIAPPAETIGSAPTPAVVSTDVRDLDAMAGAVTDGLEAEYVQLEARPFHGRWAVLRAGSMAIQFGQEDVAIVRRVRVPADKWVFIVPLAITRSARWEGRPVGDGDLVLCGPGAESYAFDPAGARFAIISVGLQAAANVAAMAGVSMESRGSSRLVRSAPDVVHALRQHLLRLKGQVETCPGILDSAPARREAERIVSHTLANCTASTRRRVDRTNEPPAWSDTVRRAEAFFRGHMSESVSIAQLSAIAGVSERSLRNAFHHVYTTSPKRYFRLWQLHQVRRTLRSANPLQASVTTVATCYGFFELGRFAGSYKALFGEAPSQTLNRAGALRGVTGLST